MLAGMAMPWVAFGKVILKLAMVWAEDMKIKKDSTADINKRILICFGNCWLGQESFRFYKQIRAEQSLLGERFTTGV